MSKWSALALVAALMAPVAAFGAPELRFDHNTITIRNVTAKAQVLLCGLTREPRSGTPVQMRRVAQAFLLEDSDGDGVVRHDFGRPVPHEGLWAAIDLTSGGTVSATTPGYERPPLALTSAIAKHDNNGQLRKMQWPLGEMHAFLVRPGTGAWKLYASRATEADESSPSEHLLRIDIGRFAAIGRAAAAPTNFRPGDVLVVFDPKNMRFGSVEVGR